MVVDLSQVPCWRPLPSPTVGSLITTRNAFRVVVASGRSRPESERGRPQRHRPYRGGGGDGSNGSQELVQHAAIHSSVAHLGVELTNRDGCQCQGIHSEVGNSRALRWMRMGPRSAWPLSCSRFGPRMTVCRLGRQIVERVLSSLILRPDDLRPTPSRQGGLAPPVRCAGPETATAQR